MVLISLSMAFSPSKSTVLIMIVFKSDELLLVFISSVFDHEFDLKTKIYQMNSYLRVIMH